MEITVFYIPAGSSEEATKLSLLAIENHLAACGNIIPVKSFFPWDGKIQDEQEVVLILKTFPTHKEALRTLVTNAHSYKTPAILSWEVDVNEDYAAWMSELLHPKP